MSWASGAFKTTYASRNREALQLYRDILRTSKSFYWPNEQGVPWSKVLRENARKEFEAARNEKDPLVVARLLVVGRDCLAKTQQKYMDMEQVMKKRIDSTRNDQRLDSRGNSFPGSGSSSRVR